MTRLFMFIPYICVSFVIISRVVCVNSFDLRSTEFPRTPFAQLFRKINTLRPAFFNNLRGKTLSGYSSNTSATLMAALRRSHKLVPTRLGVFPLRGFTMPDISDEDEHETMDHGELEWDFPEKKTLAPSPPSPPHPPRIIPLSPPVVIPDTITYEGKPSMVILHTLSHIMY